MDVSPTTWRALSKLLDEALDLEPAARAPWIDGVGATQPELAPILRKLLAVHENRETGDALQQLAPLHADAGSPIDVTGLAIGARVGRYKLKREIASGGMADVWLAERADGAFERDVALKLPRLSRLRRDLAARFARERDILAPTHRAVLRRRRNRGRPALSGDGIRRWSADHELVRRAQARHRSASSILLPESTGRLRLEIPYVSSSRKPSEN